MSYEAKTSSLSRKRIIITAGIALLILLVSIFYLISMPERSVASYCKVLNDEKAKLANAKGETYSSAVFRAKTSDAGDFADAFGELERVAPDDIRADTEKLKQIYQKIDDDPSQALSASLSGIGQESNLRKWIDRSCKD